MYELEYHDSRIEEYSINIIMGKNILLQVDREGLDDNQMEGIIDYRVDIDKVVMNHPKHCKPIVTKKS